MYTIVQLKGKLIVKDPTLYFVSKIYNFRKQIKSDNLFKVIAVKILLSFKFILIEICTNYE